MADTREELLLENDLVRVLRVYVGASAKHETPGRGPRVVISLTNELEMRAERGHKAEQIRRAPGDVVFRDSSPGHTIENTGDEPHTVIIVELKPRS